MYESEFDILWRVATKYLYMEQSWIFFASLSAFFAALVAIFGKVGIQNIDPTLATTVRSVIMAVFLVVISCTLNKFQLFHQFNRKSFLFIILAGVAGALSWLFYFHALKSGSVRGVASIDKLSVVIAIIIAAIFLGEGITLKSIIGTLLLIAGIYFLI